MRTQFVLGGSLLLALFGGSQAAQAQQNRSSDTFPGTDRPAAQPQAARPTSSSSTDTDDDSYPTRASRSRGSAASPGNEDASYQKEFIYGLNFNTRGGLIGGVSVRSLRMLNQDWARFWSIEGVEVKHPKEQKRGTGAGGSYVLGKTNYMYVLRPSVGLQRVVFRKAPESGVQVNALLSAGPSIGLLMPYYITYDYTERNSQGQPLTSTDIRNEQFDPAKHSENRILDRAPLFTGIGQTKPYLGAHVRGALSFEYGRYRDAVAGVETGFLFETYSKDLTILRATQVPDKQLNNMFFPSVYLTLYLGHRG